VTALVGGYLAANVVHRHVTGKAANEAAALEKADPA